MNLPILKRDKSVNKMSILKFISHPTFLGIVIAMLTFGLIFSLMLTAVSPERYELKVGDIPSVPIPAPRDVEDVLATQEKVEQAKERVSEIYTLDQTITAAIIADLNEIFNSIEGTRAIASDKLRDWEQEQEDLIKEWEDSQQLEPIQGSEISPENSADSVPNVDPETSVTTETPTDSETQELVVVQEPPVIQTEPVLSELYDNTFISNVQKLFPIQLSQDDIMTFITADQRELNQLRINLVGTMTEMLQIGIKKEQISEFKVNLRDAVEEMMISRELKVLGINISVPKLEANMLYNPEKTMDEKRKAADLVERVIYIKGQFIVQAGQPVTEAQIKMLAELGLLKDNIVDIPLIVGIGLVVLICMGLIIIYLFYFDKALIKKPSILLMISSILCLVLGLTYVTSLLNSYLIPAAMGGMLLAVLINPRIGVIVNMVIALLVGLMLGIQLPVVVMIIAGGMMGICLLRTMQQRNSLVWAGIGAAGVNMLAVGSFEMLTAGGWLGPINSSLWGMMGGLLSSVLTIGTLPIWENLFRVVTPIKLLELANPNQPVLKRLLMETPGTYHHSIIVANLAERAADAIGANGLLARVGAYYHDIGKLERPYYFKENQLYADNPHDKLDPILSTRIIHSHTKYGVEMAKRYNVPAIIHDFILQHHGTTPVVYFYHKAKNNSEKDMKLEDFRYSGPKPNSREVAILMMADTIEAAVRALSDHTPDTVEELIRKLIHDKLEDGQFDDSNLTIRDLNTIAIAFSSVISGIFHERVLYPEVNLNEEKAKG